MISISIAGGIVIFVLAAVVIYILRELYCNEDYANMTSSVRRSTPQTGAQNKRIVKTIDVKPSTSTDKIVPGVRKIALPDFNMQ